MDAATTGQLLTLAAVLAGAGAMTGVLAGLFGVGGGAIIVPALYEAMRFTDVPDAVRMPLAVGTSLAIIVPTSIRSAMAHYRKGAVDVVLLRLWALPVLLGVTLGAGIARFAPPWVFQLAFVLVAAAISAKLLAGKANWRIADTLPGGALLRLYGAIVGLLAALMGVGGGAISTLLLSLYGRPIRQTVATSAGVGVLISIPGAIGYVLAGWGRAGLPPDAVGFVSLLGVALVAPLSLLTAPVGVDLAHRLPPRRLEILFGLFLLVVSARFILAMMMG